MEILSMINKCTGTTPSRQGRKTLFMICVNLKIVHVKVWLSEIDFVDNLGTCLSQQLDINCEQIWLTK